jgi:hypothetical protein
MPRISNTAKDPSIEKRPRCICTCTEIICCPIAAWHIRQLRWEFQVAILSGQWLDFDRSRVEFETHRKQHLLLREVTNATS